MPNHSTLSSTPTAQAADTPLFAVTITNRRIRVAVLSVALTTALMLLAGNSVPAFLAAAAAVAVAAGGGLRIALQSTTRSNRRLPLLTLLLMWLPGGIALALSIFGAVLIFGHPTNDPMRILGVALFALQILMINLLIVRPAADAATGTEAA